MISLASCHSSFSLGVTDSRLKRCCWWKLAACRAGEIDFIKYETPNSDGGSRNSWPWYFYGLAHHKSQNFLRWLENWLLVNKIYLMQFLLKYEKFALRETRKVRFVDKLNNSSLPGQQFRKFWKWSYIGDKVNFYSGLFPASFNNYGVKWGGHLLASARNFILNILLHQGSTR